MTDLKVKVDELLSKSDEVLAMDKTIGENIELCREYLKEIDNLLDLTYCSENTTI